MLTLGKKHVNGLCPKSVKLTVRREILYLISQTKGAYDFKITVLVCLYEKLPCGVSF